MSNRTGKPPSPDLELNRLLAVAKNGVTNFTSGAVRSADTKGVRYDLVCPVGTRRVGERCYLGAVIKGYSEANWTKGMDVQDTINHIQRHLDLWKAGDRSDDHLGGAAWGIFAIMHFEERCTCYVGVEMMKKIDSNYQEMRQSSDLVREGLGVVCEAPKVDNQPRKRRAISSKRR